MRSASPRPRTRCASPAGARAQSIVFTVEDQGVGIPKEQLDKVFDRFESRSQGSKHRGAGLGLSIVQSLVELHGGTMSLDSELGRGTRVTVKLPKGGLTPAQCHAIAAARRPGGTEGDSSTALHVTVCPREQC